MQTNTHRSDCSTWTTKVVSNNATHSDVQTGVLKMQDVEMRDMQSFPYETLYYQVCKSIVKIFMR